MCLKRPTLGVLFDRLVILLSLEEFVTGFLALLSIHNRTLRRR